MNNLKLASDDVSCLLYGEDVYDENNNITHKRISEEITYTDMEKAYVNKDIIIKEIATGKYYKANLMEGNWVGKQKQNYNAKWTEVFPKEKTIIAYE